MVSKERVEQREAVLLENQGQKIFGILHLPLAKERSPVVLVNHGIGGTKNGTHRVYVMMAEALARVGIATFRIDFRGCGDSEGDVSEMTVEGQIDDARAALAYLHSHPAIDSTQIGLLGASLGGPIAIGAAKEAKGVRSLALWAPVASGTLWESDWATHYPQESMESVIRAGGTGPLFREQFLQIEAHHALAAMPHLSFLHVTAGADGVVFPGHADAYRTAREEAATLNRFLVLKESNHHFSHPEERKVLIEETTLWFKETLK